MAINLNDPDIQDLLKRRSPPRVEDVVPIAKKLKITNPEALWELFDKLTILYHDKKYSN